MKNQIGSLTHNKLTKYLTRTIVLVILIISTHKPPAVTTKIKIPNLVQNPPFQVQINNEICPFSISPLFVLPGENLNIKILNPQKSAGYVIENSIGILAMETPHQWSWNAPEEKGIYPLRVIEKPSNQIIQIHVFVMIPFSEMKNGYLNGYHIGNYPEKPLHNLEIYKPPRGFIEVTAQNKDIQLTPHFRLGQFLCKQKGSYPKYVVLREKMVQKLEYLWEKVNQLGYQCDTLHVMSGYRTPSYNAQIKNVKYSRHLWGDAADIFIDVDPRDFYLDDLNRDGVSDRNDGLLLHGWADHLDSKPEFQDYVGGLGFYNKNRVRGPFVHLDTRGFKRRWSK